MTFSAAPGGSTRSKARSALEKGDAVADQLGEAFPVAVRTRTVLPVSDRLAALESRWTALPNKARSVVGEHPGGVNDTGTDAGSVLNAELAGSAPPQADCIVR
jgi:hypothetical protein